MTRRRQIAVTLGAGAAALVAAGAAGAIGAAHVLSPSEESKAVIDDAAAQLGVEPSELTEALKQALENRIDEAVEAGRLTDEQAARLKERLESSDVPPLVGLGAPRGHGFGFGHRFGHGPVFHLGILDAAAAYLGMSEAELREALHDKTLADIAGEKGRSKAGLVDELVATQTKRIDEAVGDARLTDEQAAHLKESLEERIRALVEGDLRRPGDGRHRFWPGAGAPRGPPALAGPSA